jgi:hypothetical protein
MDKDKGKGIAVKRFGNVSRRKSGELRFPVLTSAKSAGVKHGDKHIKET